MDRKIKNLLIDFGGVLIDLDRQRCLDNFQRLGLNNVSHLLDVCHQQGFFSLHERGEIDAAGFRQCIRQVSGKPLTDEAIDDAWNSFLVTIPTYKLDLLLALRKKYKLYLLSNTNDIHWEWSCKHVFTYNGHTVNDFFDGIFLSYRMKLAKPNPDIYRMVSAQAPLSFGETLFIDDSAENCRVANELGIATYTPKAHEDWSHIFEELKEL